MDSWTRKLTFQTALLAGLLAVTANLEPLAIGAIDLYRMAISPSLDRPCPHRLTEGGESCSLYARRVIGERGFLGGMGLSLECLPLRP